MAWTSMKRMVRATILFVEYSIRPAENNSFKVNEIYRQLREMGAIYI